MVPLCRDDVQPDPVNGSEVGSSRSRSAQIEVDDIVDDDLDDEDDDEDEEEWEDDILLSDHDTDDEVYFRWRVRGVAPGGLRRPHHMFVLRVHPTTARWLRASLQGKSEINRRNRSKLTVYHTTGTKSFARKRHELLGAVHIDEVGPADLYAASHKRKNGEWICDAARMNFEKMMEVEAQATMEGRTLTDVEVFTQVLGEKRGYVRGLGDSVRPVSTSCSSSSADMARRLTETQLELEQIRADREKESQEQMHEIHSLQQKMEEMQERMARYDRFMSRFASGAFDDVGV
ncbi:hypothetical protein CJ030_MR4G026978 [Morella rubra]|uniref:Uncharacterized protein n=1 Tax=Morella rubra TaxID=262757 RepID=A0A6A1VVK2_9ROSI|nr:hypothetical protein CJ030_MR4G026978 [Morella rubra]